MEEENDDLEYHLNDIGDMKKIERQIKSYQLKSKVMTGIIIALILLFMGVFGFFIYYFVIKKGNDKNNNTNTNANTNDNTNKVFNFSSLFNISYGDDVNKIENTFKVNASNYNQLFGNINQGKDYVRNPGKNTYDLFIPEDLDKNKYNKILLFIHGGFWTMGNKTLFTPSC